ncbi:MAG: hypothetical protein K0S09_1635 [Sphingobacteriaceae bacterium]|jgi:hypothetical protein|nr:hypothetical protein [Sphingobacteriaceae bacterium]
MSDRLENFVRGHRRDFDEFEPPMNLWDRIEEQLDQEKTVAPRQPRVVKLSVVLSIAATLLVVLSAGIVFIKYQKTQAVNISNINPELADQQVHYASMIETKRSELKQIEKQDPQLYNEFASEIKKMEVSYQKLKSDLPTSPNQEETVKAMIRNLQAQIGVLNQQLNIIQQIKQIKTQQQNETQSI